jgi:hypothetical protein
VSVCVLMFNPLHSTLSDAKAVPHVSQTAPRVHEIVCCFHRCCIVVECLGRGLHIMIKAARKAGRPLGADQLLPVVKGMLTVLAALHGAMRERQHAQQSPPCPSPATLQHLYCTCLLQAASCIFLSHSLQLLHLAERNFVHCDVCPENFIVAEGSLAVSLGSLDSLLRMRDRLFGFTRT